MDGGRPPHQRDAIGHLAAGVSAHPLPVRCLAVAFPSRILGGMSSNVIPARRTAAADALPERARRELAAAVKAGRSQSKTGNVAYIGDEAQFSAFLDAL